MNLLMLVLLHAAPDVWVREEALTGLDCVHAVAQLCSPDDASSPTFELRGKQLLVRAPMHELELVLTVSSSKAGVRVVAGLVNDTPVKGRLIFSKGAYTWEGPDLLALGHGVESPAVKWKLVRYQAYRDRRETLVKQLVPGGQCQGLMVYDEKTAPAECLNTK